MNKKKLLYCLGITTMMFSVSSLNIPSVYAGSKSLVAQKKEKFKDDNVESMRDLSEKREAETKAYREKMLSNSDKTIALLEEIRDLLEQFNEGNND